MTPLEEVFAMAPSPKPPGQRVRRNKDQPNWRTLPAAKPFSPPPAPEHWSAATSEWWRLIWESPMASLWIESDVPNLLALGELIELPKKSAEHHAEIRQAKTQYGLTPGARKSLMWHIPQDDSEEADGTAPKRPTRQRHLRAVAG